MLLVVSPTGDTQNTRNLGPGVPKTWDTQTTVSDAAILQLVNVDHPLDGTPGKCNVFSGFIKYLNSNVSHEVSKITLN